MFIGGMQRPSIAPANLVLRFLDSIKVISRPVNSPRMQSITTSVYTTKWQSSCTASFAKRDPSLSKYQRPTVQHWRGGLGNRRMRLEWALALHRKPQNRNMPNPVRPAKPISTAKACQVELNKNCCHNSATAFWQLVPCHWGSGIPHSTLSYAEGFSPHKDLAMGVASMLGSPRARLWGLTNPEPSVEEGLVRL
jgi:hypothetical protein